MDQKLVVHLSAEADGHTFTFSMPIGAPLGTAYNAAYKVIEHVTQLIKDATEKSKPAEEATIDQAPEETAN